MIPEMSAYALRASTDNRRLQTLRTMAAGAPDFGCLLRLRKRSFLTSNTIETDYSLLRLSA